MKEITEKLPHEIVESESFKIIHAQVESFLDLVGTQASENSSPFPSEPTYEQHNHSDKIIESNSKEDHRTEDRVNDVKDISQNADGTPREDNGASVSHTKGTSQSSMENGSTTSPVCELEGKKEVIEQFEPGVYVTLIQLANGTKIFKRVRFRYVIKYVISLAFYLRIFNHSNIDICS